MALYRDFDQAALDAQYNARAMVPEYGDYFARWAAESAVVRKHLPARLDIAYGRSRQARLDLFPAQAERAPLLLFFHGGYWRSLDKSDFSFLAPAFVDAGVAFASVNYDLSPEAGVDEMVAQVREAASWVVDNAASLGVDAEAVFLAGHSAGGHLAAMAAAEVPVAGLCSISGVYDMEPIRLSYLNELLEMDEAVAAASSPIRLKPAQAMPILLAVGERESAEFKRQQDEFAQAWSAARSLELPGRDHFSAVDALGDQDHGLFGLVLEMIDGRL